MIDEKQIDLLSKLSSHKPKNFLIRVAIISLVAFVLVFITKFISTVPDIDENRIDRAYVLVILAFNSITELNLFIIKLFGRSKWSKNIYIQLLTILAITIFCNYFWVMIAEKTLGDDNILKYKATQIVLIIGWLVLIIHLLLTAISNITNEWMKNRKELEELKQAKLISDYNSLKDRLNPHFLFNNLSVLKSLIKYNPDAAEGFTQNFTNVYRYLLDSHNDKTVTLQKELKFLESYIALHQERIGEGLKISIQIDEALVQKKIPPMTLQLLVENAIKHNICNTLHPLKIQIFSKENILNVRNNLNLKESTYSTHTGLQSLIQQYQLLADIKVAVIKSDNYFTVRIPLL